MTRGMVFQFKRYSIHDGPGIRTTVFLKGCPLECSWCHNPESRSPEPQLAVFNSRCISCGLCIAECPQNAINPLSPVTTDRESCDVCGVCAEICPTGAREVVGREMTSRQVMDILARDVLFYRESGGGVTFSGGEPLMQYAFLLDLLEKCREMGVRTAVDTSCHAPSNEFLGVAGLTDLMLCDLKLPDENEMLKYTGVTGDLALENIRKLAGTGQEFVLRLPLVPGVTDTERNLEAVRDFIESLPVRPPLQLLPYHSTWREKCARIGMEYVSSTEPDSRCDIEAVWDYFSSAGIESEMES